VLSAAALSVLGSVADPHSALATDDIRSVMLTLVTDIAKVTLPAGLGRHSQPRSAWPAVPPAAGIYEVVLIESMQLFYQRGYQGTTMDDIAAASHTTVPVLYKHFTSKSDILVASYRRATDRISADVSIALTETSTAREGLQRLIAACVGRNLANPELSFVYYSERRNLPPGDAQFLNALRLSTVDAWARLVAETRPEFTLGMGRYAVLGAFALTVDPGRMLLDNSDSQVSATTVRRLMASVLLGTASR
jgi:AcrR family transcriptional regulator